MSVSSSPPPSYEHIALATATSGDEQNGGGDHKRTSTTSEASDEEFVMTRRKQHNKNGIDDENGVVVVDDDDDSNGGGSATAALSTEEQNVWSPSGSNWRDFLYFCGPGWFVSIAYVDPGNYQADIQAGATSRYTLLFSVWWSSVLSIYIQILCVRLSFYGKMNLAQAQARHVNGKCCMKYMNWAIAEFSTIITDLPEVIGIGIACNIFFDWPYYVGVLLSLLTTMIFLATMNYGMNVLEGIVFLFVFIMAVALFVEMSFVGVDAAELLEGWFVGFKDVGRDDIFSITGILGAVVMPHNLYLHTATLQTRKIENKEESIRLAVKWSSVETVGPILFSFFVNMAVVAIAAERVYGQVPDGEQVGLSDFCNFFKAIKGGCAMWGIALLAAGQSSAITTTYTGQYVMDGFLNLQLPVATRAILTRLVAITPCVIVSAAFPNDLNKMINIVNSALAFLLPFAFTPLVAYNCSEVIMGHFVAPKWERYLLHTLCFVIWLINAVAFSTEGGGLGGLFGESVHSMDMSAKKVVLILLEVSFQIFYAWWNWNCITTPVAPTMIEVHQDDDLQLADNTIA